MKSPPTQEWTDREFSVGAVREPPWLPVPRIRAPVGGLNPPLAWDGGAIPPPRIAPRLDNAAA
jgi:hypothetical protein